MIPSKACQNLVASFEGCRLHAYPDPGTGGAPWTIGFGHTGPDIIQGVVWTQEQADAQLAHDLERFGRGVSGMVGAAHTEQHHLDAMVSLSFNIGLANFGKSTLLQKHKAGAFEAAAEQFGRWTRASGKILPGLVRRRAAEANLYRGGAS